MKYRPHITFAGLLFAIGFSLSLRAQPQIPGLTTNPDDAVFITEDVENFLNAYRKLQSGADTVAILQAEYFDKGTPGLNTFTEKYGLTAETLTEAIRNNASKYDALDEMPAALSAYTSTGKAAFARLKEVIPDIVYPPTYFLVGTLDGVASGSPVGQLMTVDRWTIPIENKTSILVHELAHFQQAMAIGPAKYGALYGPELNLLGICIREGIAEFFSHQVTGKITQEAALDFTLEHEGALWQRFSGQLQSEELGEWTFGERKDPDQPKLVGYAIGFRIAQSYYNQATNKDTALREMLSVIDYPGFLAKSGYAEQFTN